MQHRFSEASILFLHMCACIVVIYSCIPGVLDYYARQSVSKTHGHRHVKISKGEGNYSFVVIDSSLDPGPHAPFNFFGRLERVSDV